MDAELESSTPEPDSQHEQLVARLQPESEPEERLVRQIALCSVRLEYIEALLVRAQEQLHQVLDDRKGEQSL